MDIATVARSNAKAAGASGVTSQRNCWTFSVTSRDLCTAIPTAAPPSTWYSPKSEFCSTHTRSRIALIPPLPKVRHSVVPDRTPSPTLVPEAASTVLPTPSRSDGRALGATKSRAGKWSTTPCPRDASLMGWTRTPAPGTYNAALSDFDRAASQRGHRGRFSAAKRFETPGGATAKESQRLGPYVSWTAPSSNTGGTDFGRSSGRFQRNAMHAGGQRSLDVPGPASYVRDSDGAFSRVASRLSYELSTPAASFLAQRIPFDAAAMRHEQVLSDVTFVRNSAENIARMHLTGLSS